MRYAYVLFALLVAVDSVSHCSDNNNAGRDLQAAVGLGWGLVAAGVSTVFVCNMYISQKMHRLVGSNEQISNGKSLVQENHNRALLEKYERSALEEAAVIESTGVSKDVVGVILSFNRQPGWQLYNQLYSNKLFLGRDSEATGHLVPGIAGADLKSPFVPYFRRLEAEDIKALKAQTASAQALIESLSRTHTNQNAEIERCKEKIELNTGALQGACLGIFGATTIIAGLGIYGGSAHRS